MTADDSLYDLPKPHVKLCFDIEEFAKKSFDVDQFVIECRRKVPLESLREDLQKYLDILQDSMIEIINKDYADFVRLSTNLVSLDKSINGLKEPLTDIREKLKESQSELEVKVSGIESKLSKENDIKEKKNLVQRLMNILNSVENIEKLLGLEENGVNPENELVMNDYKLERVASIFNKLQFDVNHCRNCALVQNLRPRISAITSALQSNLETALHQSLMSDDIPVIRKCLRTYALIDKCRDAEELFQTVIVGPYFEKIIAEEFISTNPRGLQAVYESILNFIPKYCKSVREAVIGPKQENAQIPGYEFVVNAVWPEVIGRILEDLTSIFNAGNPERFFEKYTLSMDFISNFEKHCSSQESVKKLRDSPAFQSFINKWSLPVYFQIRFQEIAGQLECAIERNGKTANKDNEFHNTVTKSLWDCLNRCWAGDVYVPSLVHRFWKFTLQLISRYTLWMEGIEGDEIVLTLATADAYSLVKKIPILFKTNILPRLLALGLENCDHLEKSLENSYDSLIEKSASLLKKVKDIILNKSVDQFKSVNELPRLYRRTNKEVPSKPSKYITSFCNILINYVEGSASFLPVEKKNSLILDIIQEISNQFESVADELLISVKKTEESLRRLKRKTGASASQGSVTDDNKIRMQIILDIDSFRSQAQDLGATSRVENLLKLLDRAKSDMAT